MAWGFELPDRSFISICKGSTGDAQLESIVGKRSGEFSLSFFKENMLPKISSTNNALVHMLPLLCRGRG